MEKKQKQKHPRLRRWPYARLANSSAKDLTKHIAAGCRSDANPKRRKLAIHYANGLASLHRVRSIVARSAMHPAARHDARVSILRAATWSVKNQIAQ